MLNETGRDIKHSVGKLKIKIYDTQNIFHTQIVFL